MSENQNNNINNTPNNKPKINVPRPNLTWLYVVIALVFGFLYLSSDEGSANKEISYTEFKEMVKKDMPAKSSLMTITRWRCLSNLNTSWMYSNKMPAKSEKVLL